MPFPVARGLFHLFPCSRYVHVLFPPSLSSHCEYGLLSAAVILLSLITLFGVPPKLRSHSRHPWGHVGAISDIHRIHRASPEHRSVRHPLSLPCYPGSTPASHYSLSPPARRKSDEERGATHLPPARPRNRALCLSPILPDSFFFIRALFCSTSGVHLLILAHHYLTVLPCPVSLSALRPPPALGIYLITYAH